MLTNEQLEMMLRPYGMDVTALEFIQSSQNDVYKYCGAEGDRIVRISRGRYRREEEVAAELEWLICLSQHGVKACQPIASNKGKLYHCELTNGEKTIVTVFEHAPGVRMDRALADEETFEKLGRLTGSMHEIASQQCVAGRKFERPLWQDSRLLNEDFDECRDLIDEAFFASVGNLIQELLKYPMTIQNYGLLHADIHFWNLFEYDGELWIFDFDNCEYGYFAQDLATILWDAIYGKELNKFADAGLNDRIKPLWQALLRGYAETAPLNELNLEQVRKCFLLREAIIYIYDHRLLNLTEMDESFHRGLEVMQQNVITQSHQVDIIEISNDFTESKLN